LWLQELDRLEDVSGVFKLIGPVLIRQDPIEVCRGVPPLPMWKKATGPAVLLSHSFLPVFSSPQGARASPGRHCTTAGIHDEAKELAGLLHRTSAN